MSKLSTQNSMKTLHYGWNWLLGLGILFIDLGFLGLNKVVTLTLGSIILLGGLFIVAGLAQLIYLFKYKDWHGFTWHLLIALFYLLVGGLVIYDPTLASSIVTLFIAWTLIIIGVTRFILAISLRKVTSWWGFLLVSSLAAMILGIFIIAQWPISGLWVIGLFISIELMITGWTYIFMAFSMRKNIP